MSSEFYDELFMDLAEATAKDSTCLGRQVGAVIVKNNEIIATGYNTVPDSQISCIVQGFCYVGVNSCAESDRPSRSIHAEVNAIAQAAMLSGGVKGATIYTTLHPCLNCMKAIAAAQISEVVFRDEPLETRACHVMDEYKHYLRIRRYHAN